MSSKNTRDQPSKSKGAFLNDNLNYSSFFLIDRESESLFDFI